MTASNGKKLLAEGALVDLGDGVERHVIIDLEAMLRIEEKCGSLIAYLDGLAQGWKGRLLHSLEAGLTAGLSHDPTVGPVQIRAALTAAMRGGWAEAQRYVDVLDQAWEDAMPSKEAGKAPAAGKDSAQESSSPGPSSIDEAPLTMAEATASSGG